MGFSRKAGFGIILLVLVFSVLVVVFIIIRAQPSLKLPWNAPDRWYFTQGPHKWGSSIGSGIDFAPGPKTLVLATARGHVTFAGWTSWRCADGSAPPNLNLRINHGRGWETWYLHLGSTGWGSPGPISPPDPVSQGQNVGVAFNTGCSTGTHIHLELLLNDGHENWDGKKVSGWTIHRTGEGDGYLEKPVGTRIYDYCCPAGPAQLVESDNWAK